MGDKSHWNGVAPDADALFAMAEAVLADLPAIFRRHADGLLIEIAEFADDATLDGLGIEHPHDLTGLYHGRPLTDGVADTADGLPNRVTLYRLPILIEWAETGERLDHLVRHVLIHEIGHHFGFSDEDMHRIEAAGDD